MSCVGPYGLVVKFLMYAPADDVLSAKGHALKVVLQLKQGKLGCGHSLHMYNFYNSFTLAFNDLSNTIYCSANRKHTNICIKFGIS